MHIQAHYSLVPVTTRCWKHSSAVFLASHKFSEIEICFKDSSILTKWCWQDPNCQTHFLSGCTSGSLVVHLLGYLVPESVAWGHTDWTAAELQVPGCQDPHLALDKCSAPFCKEWTRIWCSFIIIEYLRLERTLISCSSPGICHCTHSWMCIWNGKNQSNISVYLSWQYILPEQAVKRACPAET